LRQGRVITAERELDSRFSVFIKRGILNQTERDDIPGKTGIFYFTEQGENEFVRHI
jgi:hypothetical protein